MKWSEIEAAMKKADNLPATSENIAAVKVFVLRKWQEMAIKKGQPKPQDLSNACRFSAVFAAELFGGQVRGHDFHFWVVLPNKQRIDLNVDAADLKMMLRGEIPDQYQDYAAKTRRSLPKPFYSHDPSFVRGVQDSLRDIRRWTIRDWITEFLSQR